MSAATAWERLTSIATLGTARAGAKPEALWPDPALASVAGSQEQNLLRAAAATYLWTLAGQRIAACESTPSLEVPDQPAADSQVREVAAWRLGRILGGEHAMLLEEWLTLAAANHRTLPPHWVPVVLQHASPALCSRFTAVLGPTAAWLAGHNPQWAAGYVQPSEPSLERWTAGTLQERCVQLALARRHDPAMALEWLQGTWSTDPPEAREAFLKLLPLVTVQDEAFLEAALDDKRKGVRLAAAECLAGLAESAYIARAAARAEPLLGWDPGKGLAKLVRKPKLTVELPTALDKPAQRDGIEIKPPAHRKVGERAFWFTQLLALVPPAHWTQRFQCSPAELLEAARGTDYGQELLSSLSTAALRHPDREWLQALCDGWLASKQDVSLQADAIVRLLSAAGPEQSELVSEYVRVLVPKHFDSVLRVLSQLEVCWSPPVTQLVLEALCETVQHDKQQWSHARNMLESEARYCDVATARRVLPKLLQACSETSPWRNALDSFQNLVEFRAAMQQELVP